MKRNKKTTFPYETSASHIKQLIVSVVRLDRNDEDPGLNYLVVLGTGNPHWFGLTVAAFGSEESAAAHAEKLARQNGWTVKPAVSAR